MAISPMDIHHKEFNTVRMGGYNKEEVDAFLDIVADELDRILHRNQEQGELVETMRQKATQFDSMQTTLQNALINAQKSADNIIQEARDQAEAQFKEAQQQSNRMLEEAKAEKARISQSFEGIREHVLRYMATIRELLDKNQTLVKDYESRLASAELKERPASPTPPVSVERVPSREAAPVAMQKTELEEPVFPKIQEPPPVIAEMDAPPMQIEGPIEEIAATPPVPVTKVPTPSLETPFIPPIEEVPKEQAPLVHDNEEPPLFEEKAPPPPQQPPRPMYTPEQEMEIMRESMKREKEVPGPTPNDDAPAGEGQEKHFFWE